MQLFLSLTLCLCLTACLSHGLAHRIGLIQIKSNKNIYILISLLFFGGNFSIYIGNLWSRRPFNHVCTYS